MKNTAQHERLEYHRGEDYAVVMRPEDTTDDALITIRADSDEEADRWGRLIVAAPDLLEACEAYLRDGDMPEIIEFMQAAIAKARGESEGA